MKKLLLCIMAAGMVASSASAQVAGKPTKLGKVNFKNEINRGNIKEETAVSTARTATVRPTTTPVNSNAKTAVVAKVDVSTSGNIYGSLISEGGLANYNSEVNVVCYTNRKSVGLTGAAYNSGTVQTRFSTDNGATWDTSVVVFSNLAPVNRYPQGAIVNPPGNTTPLNAFIAASAPLLDGTIWAGSSFGSAQLNGTYSTVLNITNDTATIPQDMPRLGMCSGSNGNTYVLGSNYDFDAAAPYMDGFVVTRGVFNAVNNNLDWDFTNIYHAFSHDPLDDSQNFSNLGNIAFSPDGVIGYMATLGRDSVNDYLSPMPVIYKTSDAGATWSLYGAWDFSPIFATIFTPNANGLTRPFYTSRNGFDLAVDANGKLHILCEIAQAASNHVDSLNYASFGGFLFDTYEDANGLWGAVFAGTVLTEGPEDNAGTTNPNSFGWAVGWDARAQICRSLDGTKMGYVWSDTDPSISVNNEFPNLIGTGADFTAMLSSDPINFTEGTAYDANNYWEYIAGLGWDAGADFVVPTFTSTQLNPGGLDTDPWMHQFVSGIQFAPADYINAMPTTVSITSINEVPVVSTTNLIYPNPATDKAIITLDLRSNAEVSVVVLNAMGQAVKSMKVGDVSVGQHSFSLDVTDMPAGFYIVNITVGTQLISQKLNVQR